MFLPKYDLRDSTFVIREGWACIRNEAGPFYNGFFPKT